MTLPKLHIRSLELFPTSMHLARKWVRARMLLGAQRPKILIGCAAHDGHSSRMLGRNPRELP